MSASTIVSEQQNKANEAVRNLRRSKLSNGQFFMINYKRLPKGQCYLEYPEGQIRLASISSSKKDFTIIPDLSE